PAVRNVWSRTSGSSACIRGCFDKRGTIYQTMMSVQESRLTPTLSRNASRSFIDVLLIGVYTCEREVLMTRAAAAVERCGVYGGKRRAASAFTTIEDESRYLRDLDELDRLSETDG